MLIIFSLITFFFIITISIFILNINNYIFFNDYTTYKQSNIINEKNIDLWKYYIKYYNQLTWADLFCFLWTTDNNCYFRWNYGFIPPKTNINIWNFFLEKKSSFIFSWTNNLELKIKNNIEEVTYNFNKTGQSKTFKKWYYNMYIYNTNNTWEQFFITSKDTEWIKNMPFYILTYNCSCYSWWTLISTWIFTDCQYLNGTWCNILSWHIIQTWTIHTWQLQINTNLNIYQDNNKQFNSIFYITWN